MKQFLTISLLLAAMAVHAQFDAIRTLTPDQGQEVKRPVEAVIFASAPAELPAYETALLDIFQSSETTLEGKQYACRMLRFCASEASVPVLAPQLTNPRLSQFVRLVFQGLETPAADNALISALPAAGTSIQIGIIGTLGQRGSASSVPAIAPYLDREDAGFQRAAITALANIGGEKAYDALSKVVVKPELSKDWKLARLNCAEGMKFRSFLFFKSRAVQKFYAPFLEDDDENIRCAAMVGITRADPDEASDLVLEHLNAQSPRIRNTARVLLPALPSDELIEEFQEQTPATQILILSELSDRKERNVESVALKLISSENADLQQAAFQALAKVGGKKSIQPLVAAAPGNPDAFIALCELNAEGTDAAIIQALETGDDAVKLKLMTCLSLRQAQDALPVIAVLAEGDWSRMTAGAIDALANLVTPDTFSVYPELLLSTDNTKKIQALEKSVAVAAQRMPDADACAVSLIAAYGQAEGEVKYAIIRALGSVGGEPARVMLTQALSSPDPKTKDAAIRGLANWPTLDAADELLELAQNADTETQRVLALRGYIRLAGTLPDFKPCFEMCKKAAAIARPAELKAVISCVKKHKEVEVLDFLVVQYENPEVQTEAGWAICEISGHWKIKEAAAPVLKRIAETSNDKILVNEANKRLGN